MKVIHLLNSDRFSGAENVVCQIINMFKDEHDIEMLYCSPDGPIRNALEERGIKFVPVSALNPKELKRVIAEQKPDVIHAHDFTASVIATFSTSKIPVISHIHNNASWIKKLGPKTLVYLLACFKCSKILTVSTCVFDEYIFGEFFKNKVNVIGNPVNVQDIQMKSDLAKSDQKFDVCYCGRLSQEKNPLLFVEIVNELRSIIPTIKACMVGDGPMKTCVKDRITELHLEDNIDCLGFQKNPYIYIKAASVVCIPSLWEGYGLVAVESLALGVPVVCSGVGGLKDIITDNNGFICTQKEDYASSIMKLLQDDKLYYEMSSSAKKSANEMSNYDAYFKKICLEYKNLKRG